MANNYSNRVKNIFNPESKEPFKLSRSKIDLFLRCPRCFYLDRRLGISQPPGFPFTLNSAVDFLLKKEFDIHRAKNTSHPLMTAYGLDLVPFQHDMINEWRKNFKGVQYLHKPTNFIITGAIDDVWVDKNGMIYVVDYKSTSKNSEITLDADWQIGYKRQMEIYQWLMEKNGFKVSNIGYFVYCNGITDKEVFDAKLEFNVKIIPYTGDNSWVEQTIIKAKECLMGDNLPIPDENCEFCRYFETRKSLS